MPDLDKEGDRQDATKAEGKDGAKQVKDGGDTKQGSDPGKIGAAPMGELAQGKTGADERPDSSGDDEDDFKLFDESVVDGVRSHWEPQKPKVHRGFWTSEGMGRMTLERTTVDGKDDIEIWTATYMAGTLTIPIEDSGRDLSLRLNFRGDAPGQPKKP